MHDLFSFLPFLSPPSPPSSLHPPLPSSFSPSPLSQVLGDSEKAVKVMREAIDLDPLNATLYLRLLDVAASGCPPKESEAEAVFAMVQSSDLPEEVKQSFALRRAQFLEEFGSSITK